MSTGAAGTTPLPGARVLVPRAAHQAGPLVERLRAAGADPVAAPVLTIAPGDHDALTAAVHDLAAGTYELLVLTSPNGVDALADCIEVARLDPSTVTGGVRVAVVGAGTARALAVRLGSEADHVAPRATGRDLGVSLVPGAGRVLLPRGDRASSVLPSLLRDGGYEVTEVVAYRTELVSTLPDGVAADLRAGALAVVVLTSPSMVAGLAAAAGPPPWPAQVVTIGPVTSAACAELGVPVDVEADPHDLDGLLAAVEAALAGR